LGRSVPALWRLRGSGWSFLVDGCTWELLSETSSFEGLEEVRQLVESTRNLRMPLLDKLLSHLTRIEVVVLNALLGSELDLPYAAGWLGVAPVNCSIWLRLH
jgi:hypothetical protein